MKQITQSQMSKEFILFFEEGNDVRLHIEEREDFFVMLKLRFANLNPNGSVQVYGIPKSNLSDFRANHGYVNIPDQKFRLKEEEIAPPES